MQVGPGLRKNKYCAVTLKCVTIGLMKRCPCCKIKTDNFAANKVKKDGLQTYCRACVKVKNAEYYKRTPEKNPARIASRKAAIQRAKEYVWSVLIGSECVDCGESDPIVLEFDHVRGQKLGAISVMVCNGLGVEKISSEIDKCDIRCANCHRRVTAKRDNFWRERFNNSRHATTTLAT